MADYEVDEPILNTAFDEPSLYWYLEKGKAPDKRLGRRRAVVFPPHNQRRGWMPDPGVLEPSPEYATGFDLVLVNRIREQIKAWRAAQYDGASVITQDLLGYWSRDGRKSRLFYAQREAAETVIFLTEARADFLQGIRVPRDEPSDERKAAGYSGFLRYALKLATGSGKTTVMAMLAAWSVLNKVSNSSDKRFSDTVLVICPNVTIRDRLRELDPQLGDASLYRTRDIIPQPLMSALCQGNVVLTNWHVFEPQTPGVNGENSRVNRSGVPLTTVESITIGVENTTRRGTRVLTMETLERQAAAGLIRVLAEERGRGGGLVKAKVQVTRYIESDTALVKRVLEGLGGKRNILVFNDEAHHAYRITRPPSEEEETEEFGEEEEAEEFFHEATVWVDGLDKINRVRGVNLCIDLSATPYYLGRVAAEANKPFPWVVSDFGLIDAIESGLVKIPQLATRDTSGEEIAGYFNIWQWILPKLTPAERGGRKASPKPDAILKYAHTPIAMLGSLWQAMLDEGFAGDDKRPHVMILVCKNTAIAKTIYEWLAHGICPTGIPPVNVKGFHNHVDYVSTIRVDSKVTHETDSGHAKDAEKRWMRHTLDTVGKAQWPYDRGGSPIYPQGFEELAHELGRPLHPPGRDVRCIVSVGMLTEGWDCNTATHILGLRPFMSQLLCEQVVGRGLRRTDYEPMANGLMREEVAKVFGVPFEVVPFKASAGPATTPREKRYHIHALPERAGLEIRFPRVEGFDPHIRRRVTVDWLTVPTLEIDPKRIPPEVEVKGLSITNEGRMSVIGPGKAEIVTLDAHRRSVRIQSIEFAIAAELTRGYLLQPKCDVPAQALFRQLLEIVKRYVRDRIVVTGIGDRRDIGCSPYYGWVNQTLLEK